ncbi:MAG: hypothetical protein H6822_36775 [Planctomycetaceae bacterium]|nr:hypothetical protein [Planctomycetales bacterium]MCB9927744.1 hypothetical protein [Planctomycetaceae bacterium]
MRRIATFTTAGLLGVAAGIAALLTIVLLRHQQSLPKLTPEGFREAKVRWGERGPSSYDIEVSVTGRQAAVYHAEVRNGEVIAAMRDGEVLSRLRTVDTWTVPGMFTTIGSDVANLERHIAGTADVNTPQVLLRAQFDEQTGLPLRYHRTELRKWGPNIEVMWEVTRYRAVP